MEYKIYYNPGVAPSLLQPSSPPRNTSQTMYYSNHLAASIKRLETSQAETQDDLSELKGITHHIASQLKEFKNKVLNMLFNLGKDQNQTKSNQNIMDDQVMKIRNDIDWMKTFIQDLKTEQAKYVADEIENVTNAICEFKNEETNTIAKILESDDIKNLLIEDISKKQSVTNHKLNEELNEIKVLIHKLKSQNIEQNDIHLEYQKLHEKLLYKIVKKQIDLEEVR